LIRDLSLECFQFFCLGGGFVFDGWWEWFDSSGSRDGDDVEFVVDYKTGCACSEG
jgi:hypothetical protein